MKISVSDGTFTIVWTVKEIDGHIQVVQVDKLGTYPLDFRNAHTAITWMLTQAEYAVNVMGFKYILS